MKTYEFRYVAKSRAEFYQQMALITRKCYVTEQHTDILLRLACA